MTKEELNMAADKYLREKGYLLTTKNGEHLAEAEAKGLFKAGAKWKEEQMKVVYVVTRCEEHSDYVEEVFLDESKAKEYCKQFEGNEDAYARHITKTKLTI